MAYYIPSNLTPGTPEFDDFVRKQAGGLGAPVAQAGQNAWNTLTGLPGAAQDAAGGYISKAGEMGADAAGAGWSAAKTLGGPVVGAGSAVGDRLGEMGSGALGLGWDAAKGLGGAMGSAAGTAQGAGWDAAKNLGGAVMGSGAAIGNAAGAVGAPNWDGAKALGNAIGVGSPAIGSPEYKKMMESYAGGAPTGPAISESGVPIGAPGQGPAAGTGLDAGGNPPVPADPVGSSSWIDKMHSQAGGTPAPAAGAGGLTIPELPNAPVDTAPAPADKPTAPVSYVPPKVTAAAPGTNTPLGAGINDPAYGPGVQTGAATANTTALADIMKKGMPSDFNTPSYQPNPNNNTPYGGGGSPTTPGNFKPLQIGGPIPGDMTGQRVGGIDAPVYAGGLGGGAGGGYQPRQGFSLGGLESLLGGQQAPQFNPPPAPGSGGSTSSTATSGSSTGTSTTGEVFTPPVKGGTASSTTTTTPISNDSSVPGAVNGTQGNAAVQAAANQPATPITAPGTTATPASTTPAATPNSTLAQQVSGSYQTANDQANAANQQRYDQGLSALTGSYGRAMDALAGLSGQDQTDLLQNKNANLASAQQSLTSRGLGNTTAVDNINRGINSDYVQNAARIRDNRTRELSQTDQNLTKDIVGFIEGRSDNPPDYGQMLQLLQALGLSGKA